MHEFIVMVCLEASAPSVQSIASVLFGGSRKQSKHLFYLRVSSAYCTCMRVTGSRRRPEAWWLPYATIAALIHHAAMDAFLRGTGRAVLTATAKRTQSHAQH